MPLQNTVTSTSQVFPDNQTEHKQTTSNSTDHSGKRERTKTHRTQSCCETKSTGTKIQTSEMVNRTNRLELTETAKLLNYCQPSHLGSIEAWVQKQLSKLN